MVKLPFLFNRKDSATATETLDPASELSDARSPNGLEKLAAASSESNSDSANSDSANSESSDSALPDSALPDSALPDSESPDSELLKSDSPTDQPRETSLRLRLLRTVLPVVLAPLMIAGLMGYRLVQQRTETRTQEQLKNQALLTSESAVAVIDELLALPQTIATSPLVINEAMAGSQQAIAAGYDTDSTDALEDEFEQTKLLRRHTRLNTYLADTAKNAGISEILVTEANGLNVAYSQPVTDFVQSDETWWQQGKAQQQWISPPDFDYAAKGFTVTLAQAIVDPATGDFAGVVRAVLPTRKFSLLAQHLKRTGIIGSQRVQLVDGASLKVIDTFSPQGFREGRDIIGGEPLEQFIEGFVEQTAGQSQPILAFSDRSGTPPSGLIKDSTIVFSDEATTVVSFVQGDRQFKIANIPDTQWVAITSMERSEISSSARDALGLLTLTTLLLAGITTVLILRLAKQLSSPLSLLAAQTEQVASGNFKTLVVPTSRQGGTTESRALTRRFNDLTVRVQSLLRHQESETQKAQLFAAITGARINDLTGLSPLLARILPEARKILNSERLLFYPISRDQMAALATESAGPQIESALAHRPPTKDLERDSLIAQPGSLAIAINNVTTVQYDPDSRAYFDDLDIWATLSIPVFQDDARFGILVAHRNTATAWSSADIHFMTQLAAQLKLVLDRVASLKAVQRSQQSAQASQQAADVLSAENRQQTLVHSRQQEQLQQQIRALVERIQGVSAGDLTIRAEVTGGELETVADIFNLTVTRLQSLVGQVQQSTVQVNKFLTQDEAIATQLAQATSAQTQEAQKTLENVQRLGASMGVVAKDAREAADTANMLATTVETGETGMTLTATRIHQLNNASMIAIKQIEGLGRSGDHIGQVTEIIREIADEISTSAQQVRHANVNPDDALDPTSLAHKIDRLAMRMLEETNLIDSFLKSLEQRSDQVAESINQINKQVSQSTQLVEESKQSFEEVAVVAKQFDQLAGSIASTTESQSQISDVVANLVQEVITLSAQAATFSQEMEATLTATLETAQTLGSSVSQFKI